MSTGAEPDGRRDQGQDHDLDQDQSLDQSQDLDQGSPTVEQLRAQISRDRHELAETVGALRDKTDVAERLRNRAAGAETAVVALAAGAARTVEFFSAVAARSLRIVSAGVDRMPQPVRTPMHHAVGVVQRQLPRARGEGQSDGEGSGNGGEQGSGHT